MTLLSFIRAHDHAHHVNADGSVSVGVAWYGPNGTKGHVVHSIAQARVVLGY